jgi:hypothetical protein
MKHVSMMPPTEEPAYRKRLRERQARWAEQEAIAAHIEFMAQSSVWDEALMGVRLDALKRLQTDTCPAELASPLRCRP